MKKSHILLMVLCCVVPIAGIAAIRLFGIPANNVLYFGLVLICPLLHGVMMLTMGREHSHSPSTALRPRAPEAVEELSQPGRAP